MLEGRDYGRLDQEGSKGEQERRVEEKRKRKQNVEELSAPPSSLQHYSQ